VIEIRHILCPIDFSDSSQRAFDHAVAIARWYGSTIALLHVVPAAAAGAYAPAAPLPPLPGLTDAERYDLDASMRRVADVASGSGVPLEFALREGNPATEIVFAAGAAPIDLLVMGTHGRSGFERLMVGSVTEKVLRKAACPVLTVPGRAHDAVPLPPVLFKRIVCAVDFSMPSMKGLDFAISLAKEADARLTVLHVIEAAPELEPDAREAVHADAQDLTDYVAAVRRQRGARLASAIPDDARTYCTAEPMLALGTPHREIVRVATEQGADLIVIGIHGRGAVDRLFFGSTTQQVVRAAACPVLTLRR
jgi:nucleotide-binding universal stress UspA family protein